MRTTVASVFLVATLLLAACSPVALATPAAPALNTTSPQAPVSGSASAAVAAFQETLESVYNKVNASVVNIRVVQKQTASSQSLPDIPGFPFPGPRGPQGPQDDFQQGAGSGFVWDKQGHIVTNNHVVAGADRIVVTFHDGTTVSAKVVGTDPDSDLAVIKVDVAADRLQPVTLADSTQAKVGQLAIAIGNPFGLQGTMTTGIVSAIGRLLPVDSSNATGPSYTIPDVIQTDAAINPGNSGGLLLDDQGHVLGVTSAIISPVRASAGIGFAIPSAIVKKVVPSLMTTGTYVHPYLGIAGATLNPDIAKAMNLGADQRGALVIAVTGGGPAEKAGLRGSTQQVTIDGRHTRVGGDVIVAVAGKPVKTFDDLVTYLSRSASVGQTLTLDVLRDGKHQTVTITPAARPTSPQQTAQAPTQQAPNRRGPNQQNPSPRGPDQQAPAVPTRGPTLGVLGVTVTPAIAAAMNLPANSKGVLVQQAISGSPAAQAGLRGSDTPLDSSGSGLYIGGDIIVAMDGQPTATVEELRALLQKAQPGQQVTLDLLRNGQTLQATVTLTGRSGTTP